MCDFPIGYNFNILIITYTYIFIFIHIQTGNGIRVNLKCNKHQIVQSNLSMRFPTFYASLVIPKNNKTLKTKRISVSLCT